MMPSSASSVSSRSASASSFDKERDTPGGISTSIRANVSKGKSLQINGHIAGKIYNLNL